MQSLTRSIPLSSCNIATGLSMHPARGPPSLFIPRSTSLAFHPTEMLYGVGEPDGSGKRYLYDSNTRFHSTGFKLGLWAANLSSCLTGCTVRWSDSFQKPASCKAHTWMTYILPCYYLIKHYHIAISKLSSDSVYVFLQLMLIDRLQQFSSTIGALHSAWIDSGRPTERDT